jgi:hypothetical protein
MDDMIEFSKDSRTRQRTVKAECSLATRATIILSSSDYLKSQLTARYGRSDITVVNNAIAKYLLENERPEVTSDALTFIKKEHRKCKKIVLYVGTVSSWFDYDLIETSLTVTHDVVYVIVGPCEVKYHPNSKIVFFRPVSHDAIMDIMLVADALVLPFKECELVKSVNPVKVYEYICVERPILLKLYSETEKFVEYAYLFNDQDEYNELLTKVDRGILRPRAAREKARAFVQENTWEHRGIEVASLLDARLSGRYND